MHEGKENTVVCNFGKVVPRARVRDPGAEVRTSWVLGVFRTLWDAVNKALLDVQLSVW